MKVVLPGMHFQLWAANLPSSLLDHLDHVLQHANALPGESEIVGIAGILDVSLSRFGRDDPIKKLIQQDVTKGR